MTNKLDLSKFSWLNEPCKFNIKDDQLTLVTDPETDFWQKTYYGFSNDNAPSFIIPVEDQTFTFTVKSDFDPQTLFDQCGIVMYQDGDNWFKFSVEYDNDTFSRLGGVVTNLGYSDWSSVDVDPKLTTLHYRLSRRDQDFMVEYSEDGQFFHQMRMFHMHQPIDAANIGVYACSPLQSSVTAVFSGFSLGPCQWEEFVKPV